MNDDISDDDLLAECRARGLLPLPRDPDGELQANWEQMHHLLSMAEGRAQSGAKLIIRHPEWIARTADMKALARSAILRKVDAILAMAVAVREEGAHDAA
jgi:hypothetical protein